MIRTTFRRAALAVVLLVSMLCQGTWALAGTTGGLSGTVTDAQSNAPISGAKVTVSSPSQTATSTTDSAGHFAFLSLAPDTYTVAVEHAGYEPISVPGNPVFADTVQRVGVRMATQLKTIATVRTQGAGSLVRSGTTADVYAINSATQEKVSGVGGGGGLNSAYSAIATVPGAYVAGNQSGYFQTVHIRGGDFDQVGYEFDGVPINRSFDNYPSGAASSLGQQEVQVYTGAAPSNSESQGLAGFINQVIKTGTSPGFADGQLGIGTPYYYHHALAEAGGASPNRLFSYYVGLGGLNQGNTYVDSTNAQVYNSWLGVPIAQASADTPWQQAGPEFALPASISVRDTVFNVHFGIPHHKDGGRDDIQLLYDGESINNGFYQSPFQAVGTDTSTAFGQASFLDGYNWNCGSGQLYDAVSVTTVGSCLSAYLYPNHEQNRFANVPGVPTSCPTETQAPPRSPCSFIPLQARDTSWNDQQIVKVQYQKNFGSSAYLRLYGYTYYSDWLLDGPTGTYDNLVGTGLSPLAPDYELTSHTRGVSLNFSDQLNQQNLLSVQGSYTTAHSTRDNNTQMFNGILGSYVELMAVNAADPYSGYCFGAAGGAPVSCAPGGPAAQASLRSIGRGTLPSLPATCADPNVATTTCAFLATENGLRATYNTVVPEFTAYSFTDQLRPSERWLFNFGVRWDNYKFVGSNLNAGPARQFWYNAFNLSNCLNNTTKTPVDVGALGTAPGTCPAGFTPLVGSPFALRNDVGTPIEQFMIFQPRLAFTFTASPDTVIRGSVGKYAQPPNSAFEQYGTLDLNEPYRLLGPNFLQFGRTTPSYSINPPTSTNVDLSLEHHFRNTDMSVKLTPFYRHTQNQIQNFFLNQATGFISGLNVGQQLSRGFEFQFQKGDFSRNGLSALLSFAYTYSTIKYGTLTNGTTIISPINTAIANYNAYTSACAPGGSLAGKSQFGQPLCGTTNSGASAAPCYNAAGAPDPGCAAGDIGNPYWSAPGQGLIDPTQSFQTYDIFPAGIGSSASAFGAPYTSTLILNYKHDKWAITPSLQFQGGTRYGAPETTPGIFPDVSAAQVAGGATPCGVGPAGTNSNYPYGNPGTNVYDATTCPGGLAGVTPIAGLNIPDPYTKTFDNLGAFVQPNQLMLNLQISYDVSPRITLTGVFANIVNACWGGTKAAWTVSDPNICSYGVVTPQGLIAPAGNTFNPGDPAGNEPWQRFPYQGYFGPFDINGLNTTSKQPFNMFFEARIKL